MVTVLAFVVLQVSVTGCPAVTLPGAAENCAVGAGFDGVGVGLGLGEPFKEPPPQPN
jgi:hypothetical protein